MSPFSCFDHRLLLLLVSVGSLFCSLASAQLLDPNNPIATTSYGRIRGTTMNIGDMKSVAAFIGIPFAAAPTRGNRFRVSLPLASLIDLPVAGICTRTDAGRCLFRGQWPESVSINRMYERRFAFVRRSHSRSPDGCLSTTPGNIASCVRRQMPASYYRRTSVRTRTVCT